MAVSTPPRATCSWHESPKCRVANLLSGMAMLMLAAPGTEATGSVQEGDLRRHYLEVWLAVHGSGDEKPGMTLGDLNLASRRLSDVRPMEKLSDVQPWMQDVIQEQVRKSIVMACGSKNISDDDVHVNLADGYYNMKGLIEYVSSVGGSDALRKACCSPERLGAQLLLDLNPLPDIHSIFEGHISLEHVSCRRSQDSDQPLTGKDGEAVWEFLGIVAVLIALLHMAIMPGSHARFYFWMLVSGAMSIFTAALAVSGLGALADVVAAGRHWARAFLAYIILFAMLALMQVAIYYVPKNRAAVHDLDLRAWIKADVQQASYGEEVPSNEVRAKSDMRSIAFVEGQEHFVRKVRPEREKRLLRIRSFVFFLSHTTAFAAVQAGAAFEHLLFFVQFPVTGIIPVMLNQVILFGFLRVMQYVRSTWRQEGCDKMLDEEVHEAESELASMTLSFLAVQALRYLISGALTNIDGLEEAEDPHHFLCVTVLVFLAFAGFGGGAFLAQKIGKLAPFTWGRRLWRAWQNTVFLCGAWCLFWGMRWYMRVTGWAVLSGQTVIASLLSLASLGTVCVLGYVESGKFFLYPALREKMGDITQSTLVALSALVGFSWAVPFHNAIVSMTGEAYAGLGCFLLGLVAAALLLPAWFLYAVPRALRYRQLREDMLEASQTGDRDKLALMVDEGFWDEGFGRCQPGGLAATVWRFYRRQNDKWAEKMLDAALPGTGVTMPLQIIVQRADGLRAADLNGLSDPYVRLEVPGKKGFEVETPVICKNLNPVWNHEVNYQDYTNGDPLLFSVFDKDLATKDDCLGRAVLTASQFLPDGFEGEVPIVDDQGKGKPTLYIKILPGAAQIQPEKQPKLARPGQPPRPESSWYRDPLGKQVKPLG